MSSESTSAGRPYDLSDKEIFERALAIARQLEGLSVLDAELVLKDASVILQRTALVSTKGPRFSFLEEQYPCFF